MRPEVKRWDARLKHSDADYKVKPPGVFSLEGDMITFLFRTNNPDSCVESKILKRRGHLGSKDDKDPKAGQWQWQERLVT